MMVEQQANEALAFMRSHNHNIKMEYENQKSINYESFPDRFYSVPANMGTDGTLIMGLEEIESNGKTNLVKIPPDGAVYHHFHKDLIEYVMVVLGCVNYKVYESDIRSGIVDEGTLKKGEKLVVNPLQTHYVFTSDKTAYIVINFEDVI